MLQSPSRNGWQEIGMKRSAWIGMAVTITVKTITISSPSVAAESNPAIPATKITAPSVMTQHPEGKTALVDLSNAPLSPSALTEGKKNDVATLVLRAAKRENINGAGEFSALITRQKARDTALMEIIGPDSPLTHAFAHALEEKYGSFFAPHIEPANQHAIAMQMVQSIFLNRRDDLASMQTLYGDVQWRQDIRARIDKGEVPELNVTLDAAKKDELKNTALYVHNPETKEGKIEPAVHSHLTALAQHIGHAGLADLMRPDSPVHQKFQEEFAKALPNDPAAKEWLNDWLYLRAERAEAVVKEFRPDGELMQKAVEESETIRRSRMKTPPAVIRAPAAANDNPRETAPAEPKKVSPEPRAENTLETIGKHARALVDQLHKETQTSPAEKSR
jgi:hypothetical protein